MKKYSAAGLVLAMVFGLVMVASAQVREVPDGAKKFLPPGLVASTTAQNKLPGRIQLRAGELSDRLNASLARAEDLLTRVKSRIEKLAAEGRDVVTAKAKVAEAEQSLVTAKASVAQLETKLSALTVSTTPRQAWAAAKTEIQATITVIKQSHQAIIEVIRSLVPKAGTATTTPAR